MFNQLERIIDILSTIPEINISESSIVSPSEYIDVTSTDQAALLHGHFSAQQLKAISQWMELKAVQPNAHPAKLVEERADKSLLMQTLQSMEDKLTDGRNKGRYGWWNDQVCTVDDLYVLREKALRDNDHVSVINFTAMIAARED